MHWALSGDTPMELVQSMAYREASIRGPVVLGLTTIVSLSGVLLLWSALVPLASATLAAGTLEVSSYHKVVQHPDGGIIREILVHDGDRVTADQVLLVLDDAKLTIAYTASRNLLARCAIQKARLYYENGGEGGEQFTLPFAVSASDEVAAFANDQQQFYMARKNAFKSRLDNIEQDRRDAGRMILALIAQMNALQVKTDLASKELDALIYLEQNGAGTRRQVSQARATTADLSSEQAALKAKFAEQQSRFTRADIDTDRIRTSYKESIQSELLSIDRECLEAKEKADGIAVQLKRLELRSPAAGVVTKLSTHTVGGVIQPGQPILEIVPVSDTLVVEAQIRPADINDIQVGQSVEARLIGRLPNTPPLHGVVRKVSPDRLIEQTSGQPFYSARIELSDTPFDLEQAQIVPGLPMDVTILKKERTVLSYLAEPLIRFFRKSMKD